MQSLTGTIRARRQSEGSLSRRTPWLPRVTFSPCDDVFSFPDPAYSQHRFRLWEVGMCVKQLMNALSGDTENLRHFRHTHQILRHSGKLAKR